MKTLGILGGMGPLASAELLRTLYDLNLKDPEQDSPHCVLLSDPTIPDRTQAILEGSEDLLLARLCQALQTLSSIGAERIVIACVTAHHFLPQVPEPLRRKVVSLIDVVIDEVLAVPRRYLLLTTTGTRTALKGSSSVARSSICCLGLCPAVPAGAWASARSTLCWSLLAILLYSYSAR